MAKDALGSEINNPNNKDVNPYADVAQDADSAPTSADNAQSQVNDAVLQQNIDTFKDNEQVKLDADLNKIQEQTKVENDLLNANAKVQQQNQQNVDALMAAEYEGAQKQDKFGWTGGQAMDQDTRMSFLQDTLKSDSLTNENMIKEQYKNDITKAKASAAQAHNELAKQAMDDAYSKAVTQAQLTGVYVDPIANEVMGRYMSAQMDGTEVPDDLKRELAAFGMATKNEDGTFTISESQKKMMTTMTTITTTMDGQARADAVKQYMIESQGLDHFEFEANYKQDQTGKWIDKTEEEEGDHRFGSDKRITEGEYAGNWTDSKGNIVDHNGKTVKEAVADAEDDGVERDTDTGYAVGWESTLNNAIKKSSEIDAVKELVSGTNQDTIKAISNATTSEIKVSLKDDKWWKGEMNDEYAVTIGDKTHRLTGAEVVAAWAATGKKYSEADASVKKLIDGISNRSRGWRLGNKYDGTIDLAKHLKG